MGKNKNKNKLRKSTSNVPSNAGKTLPALPQSPPSSAQTAPCSIGDRLGDDVVRQQGVSEHFQNKKSHELHKKDSGQSPSIDTHPASPQASPANSSISFEVDEVDDRGRTMRRKQTNDRSFSKGAAALASPPRAESALGRVSSTIHSLTSRCTGANKDTVPLSKKEKKRIEQDEEAVRVRAAIMAFQQAQDRRKRMAEIRTPARRLSQNSDGSPTEISNLGHLGKLTIANITNPDSDSDEEMRGYFAPQAGTATIAPADAPRIITPQPFIAVDTTLEAHRIINLPYSPSTPEVSVTDADDSRTIATANRRYSEENLSTTSARRELPRVLQSGVRANEPEVFTVLPDRTVPTPRQLALWEEEELEDEGFERGGRHALMVGTPSGAREKLAEYEARAAALRSKQEGEL